MRKALSILADMGLIETSKGRGSVVLFSIEEMKNHNQYAQELEDYKRSFMETNEVRLMPVSYTHLDVYKRQESGSQSSAPHSGRVPDGRHWR